MSEAVARALWQLDRRRRLDAISAAGAAVATWPATAGVDEAIEALAMALASRTPPMKRSVSSLATALAALVLMIPLAARTAEPYHNSAIVSRDSRRLPLSSWWVWWRRVYALAVVLAAAGYALSLIARRRRPIGRTRCRATGARLLGHRCVTRRGTARQAQVTGRHLAIAAVSGVGVAGVAAVIAVIGSWPGPGGLPAEVLGVAARRARRSYRESLC